MKTSIIYAGIILLTLSSSCDSIRTKHEQEKVLSPEEEFRKKVTGQWICEGLSSDTQVVFLPNGKGFHKFQLDARTREIISHEEFPSWKIKKGYYLHERDEFFYVDIDDTPYFFVNRHNHNQLITPYGERNYYTTGEGELQFLMYSDIEKEYASGSTYDKVPETVDFKMKNTF